ncbi:hypothetical protein JCM14467A_21810 [Vulcanisaeta sp. JCM 14467]
MIAIIVIAITLVTYFILIPHISYIEVDALYAFIINSNGRWFIEYYDEGNNLHTLGPYIAIIYFF